MTVRLEDEAIQVLLSSLSAEGDPKILFGSDAKRHPAASEHAWGGLLGNETTPSQAIGQLWSPLKDLLPQTVELLQRKTSCLGLLLTTSRPPSLLYCFGTDKSLSANRGYPPASQFAEVTARFHLASDIGRFYSVHDGWVDVFSADGGPVPVADWQVMGETLAPFLAIYWNGSMSMGFDLSIQPPGPFALVPDEEAVAPIADLWAWLDQTMADTLEDLDDANDA